MNLSLTQTIFLALAVSVAATAALVAGVKVIWWAWKKFRRRISRTNRTPLFHLSKIEPTHSNQSYYL
jgi:hypothetical protein